MDKILFIDKPSGITSFDVIRRLRNKLGVKKMGHAGTLDPLATGLLIIAVGSATKEISKYMGLPKEYEVLIEFGKTSTTYDADGEISQGVLRQISRAEFENVLKNFIGEIMQMPPIFSAKKIKGIRAYDLARQGKDVKLEPRKVQIDKIEILEWSWPFVRLRVNCGKGTYIRSLAHDIGEKLGCGGYVKELKEKGMPDEILDMLNEDLLESYRKLSKIYADIKDITKVEDIPDKYRNIFKFRPQIKEMTQI